MMMDKSRFRIAMRVEGDWWVAYFAEPGSMDGAIEVARFPMRVAGHLAVRDAILVLVQDLMKSLLSGVLGLGGVEDFEISSAPEHERAGRS